MGVCSSYKGAGQPLYNLPAAHLRFTPRSLQPNQELSVLYGGPTLNYGGQLSLYIPHMLRLNMTRDLAHMQLSDYRGGNVRFTGRKNANMPNVMAIFPIEMSSRKYS